LDESHSISPTFILITEYSTTQRALIWIGAKVVINGKITDTVIKTMVKSLENHKLLNEK